MRPCPGFIVTVVTFCVSVGSTIDIIRAQVDTVRPGSKTGRSRNSAGRTTIYVDILTDKQGVGLRAQQWRQTFEQIGFSVRIRRSILDEKPQIKERKLGRLREVTVIGKLDRSGKLIFPDRSFSISEGTALREWLRSLKTYGSQGVPEGQPIWGLNKAQFTALYQALSTAVTKKLRGLPLEKALASMPLPAKYPVRFSVAARNRLAETIGSDSGVRNRLKGHSTGTALALMLNEYDLGFRPLRTPEASIELVIEPLNTTRDVWPVGWEPKENPAKTAPELFKFVPVQLDDVKLVDVLQGISALTEVPIHIDHYGIESRGIDVNKIVVSYPSKKTTWSLLLRGITAPQKLTRKYRIDERGRAFIWVTPFFPKRSQK